MLSTNFRKADKNIAEVVKAFEGRKRYMKTFSFSF